MGKLADYWAELKKTKVGSARHKELQSLITGIEKWMIKEGHKKEGTETDWNNYKPGKYMPQKDKYGDFIGPAHEGHVMKHGYDRCKACRYNKNPNCCTTCHESGALLSWCAV